MNEAQIRTRHLEYFVQPSISKPGELDVESA